MLGKRIVSEEDPDIPKAFIRVDLLEKQREKLKNSGVGMKLDDIRPTVDLAADYQRRYPYTPTGGKGWLFYYRYSEERYESFVEVLNGKGREKSPAWYNAGVTELMRLQDADGAWGTSSIDFCPPEVCTAFAMLYMIRSTQKTIAKMNEGFQIGGYRLPSDASTVKRVGDKIVSEETATVEGLLEILEKNKSDNVEISMVPENLVLSKDRPNAKRKSVACRAWFAMAITSRDRLQPSCWDAATTSTWSPT